MRRSISEFIINLCRHDRESFQIAVAIFPGVEMEFPADFRIVIVAVEMAAARQELLQLRELSDEVFFRTIPVGRIPSIVLHNQAVPRKFPEHADTGCGIRKRNIQLISDFPRGKRESPVQSHHRIIQKPGQPDCLRNILSAAERGVARIEMRFPVSGQHTILFPVFIRQLSDRRQIG